MANWVVDLPLFTEVKAYSGRRYFRTYADAAAYAMMSKDWNELDNPNRTRVMIQVANNDDEDLWVVLPSGTKPDRIEQMVMPTPVIEPVTVVEELPERVARRFTFSI